MQFSLNLSPEEYRAVLKRRIETCLREADIPDTIIIELMNVFSRGDIAQPVSEPHQETPARLDQRQKSHWPAPGAKPIADPATISDDVLNAMFKGCRTVPQIEKAVKKPRKSIYTALWALKRDGLIDKGQPPRD